MRKIYFATSCLLYITLIMGITGNSANAQSAGSGMPLVTTGVYFGSCGGNLGVSIVLPMPLFGLGNSEDPLCFFITHTLPLPIGFRGYLANLAVASEESSSTVPTTITLYVNGNPTQLSCVVSESAPNCRDEVHRVAVQPSDTFAVFATCTPPPIGNCATGLQASVDRKQLLGK